MVMAISGLVVMVVGEWKGGFDGDCVDWYGEEMDRWFSSKWIGG